MTPPPHSIDVIHGSQVEKYKANVKVATMTSPPHSTSIINGSQIFFFLFFRAVQVEIYKFNDNRHTFTPPPYSIYMRYTWVSDIRTVQVEMVKVNDNLVKLRLSLYLSTLYSTM